MLSIQFNSIRLPDHFITDLSPILRLELWDGVGVLRAYLPRQQKPSLRGTNKLARADPNPLTVRPSPVVPTHPKPPPVPGYYGLSNLQGIKDAYGLVSTYRLDDEGPDFNYKAWELRKSASNGKLLLRYSGDPSGEWRWLAVRETVYDGYQDEDQDKWVPWYVKPSTVNDEVLSGVGLSTGGAGVGESEGGDQCRRTRGV